MPRSAVHPIPAGLCFEQAAAFPLVFETAYRMLVTKARLQPDEWVLIWGIGSGVATAALAIAHGLGARTIVTSSSPRKLEQARAARRRRDARPRRRRRARPRQGADRRRRPGRRRARRRRDVGSARWPRPPARHGSSSAGRPRAEPTGRAAPDLVARAGRVRLDTRHAGRLPRRLRPDRLGPGIAGGRRRLPAGRGVGSARAARERRAARQDRAHGSPARTRG